MSKTALFAFIFSCSPAAFAGTFYGIDFFCVYECTGTNENNGPLRGRLDLNLNHKRSRLEFGAYDINFDGGDTGNIQIWRKRRLSTVWQILKFLRG